MTGRVTRHDTTCHDAISNVRELHTLLANHNSSAVREPAATKRARPQPGSYTY